MESREGESATDDEGELGKDPEGEPVKAQLLQYPDGRKSSITDCTRRPPLAPSIKQTTCMKTRPRDTVRDKTSPVGATA